MVTMSPMSRLTFPATGARLPPLAGARWFTRVRVRWAVRRRLHLAPQRHVGGSPLTQHTATRPRHRHTAYMAKTNEPYVGSSMRAPPRRRTAKIPMTTRPCHTLGRPQPQPERFAGYHYMRRLVIAVPRKR